MTKLCTIVGMGPGVSFSVAKRFAKEGFTIAMIARNTDNLRKFANELKNSGFDAHSFVADVSNFDELSNTFDTIKNKLGDTDILVYNVSIYREASPTQLSAETSVEDFKANVAGALVAIQKVVPQMKKKGEGTIFITGGGQGLEPYHVLSSLAIGKSAIRSMCFSLHQELKPEGIKVATVTINGQVSPNTKFAPDLICEEFWKLYQIPLNDCPREVIYE